MGRDQILKDNSESDLAVFLPSELANEKKLTEVRGIETSE